ncbi:hypothetical protein G7Y89_g10190 [Cudoniella acicularis]|uniref:Aminoglycoside phosphotransferase domain-containing protein n=1 Tax=Cudoniella acicularis TaxID=354080 RepID=A0A8H4REB2_9HELO|nr:hypothetical protein G7Y89_g10190 [Cudoniella acicularis]
MTQPSIFRWQGQHNDKRSARTFKYTDWTALLKEAQILNGGRSCVFDGPYHAGGRHIVRRLEFIDGGQLWLVRIPILPASSTCDQNEILKWWTAERRFTMESEIATMKFIAEFTDIPVPTIFGHRTSIDGNPVKLPYMLMQCIRGNMLFDLGGPSILTGEQKSRIRKSIALIQCQMATASINKLGSLVLGPNGTIDIGPLPASFGFKGPFTSAADYFLSWAAHTKFGNLDFLHGRLEDNDRLRSLKRAVISFPSRLKSAVEKRSSRNLTAYENRYPIVHRDFLLHNILFDDTYNVVGVIDWEFAHSAPLEVFTALTNMYSCFDSKTLHAVTDRDDEGRQYIKDVMDEDIRQGCKLSKTFGSILGDIGLCMTYFEGGKSSFIWEITRPLRIGDY